MIDIAIGFVAIILATFDVDQYHQTFKPASTVFGTEVDAVALWFGGCVVAWNAFKTLAANGRLQLSVPLNLIAQAQPLQHMFERSIDSTLNCSLSEGLKHQSTLTNGDHCATLLALAHILDLQL